MAVLVSPGLPRPAIQLWSGLLDGPLCTTHLYLVYMLQIPRHPGVNPLPLPTERDVGAQGACFRPTLGHFRRPRRFPLVPPSDTGISTNTTAAKRDPVSLLKQKFVKRFRRLTSFPAAEQAVPPPLHHRGAAVQEDPGR